MLKFYVKTQAYLSGLLERIRDEDGLETAEYVLIAAAVVIAALSAYTLLGNAISDFINNTLIPSIQ